MRALGIILAGGGSERMRELSKRSAPAAMPVGGGFRCVDFALSSMSNSRIKKVAVLVQYNSASLSEHLMSSKWWDFGRKTGGLYLLSPAVTPERSRWYRGTADSLHQNIDWLRNSHEPYVIVASGDGVYKVDYNKVLQYHVEKRADITIVYTRCSPSEDPTRFGILRLNENSRVEEFEEKPDVTCSDLISAGIYVIRRRQLIEMLEQCNAEGGTDLVRDILIPRCREKRIFGYPLETYWSNISTVESYYRTNMDFLKPEVRDYFFNQYPGIYSKNHDLPPAKFNSGSCIRNSLVSAGCSVNGTVENSILFQNVYIGNGCEVKNSIILGNVYIGDNSQIENCIVESNGTIRSNSFYRGEDGIKIVIEENERYAV